MMNLIKLAFNPMNFLNNLPYMAIGMVIIIAVIAIIIGAISVLNYIANKKK